GGAGRRRCTGRPGRRPRGRRADAPAERPGRGRLLPDSRTRRLERRLGVPWADGPAGRCAAGTRRLPPTGIEALLAEEGIAGEFVPAEHGGRLVRADLLARVLRPVFRHDAALGRDLTSLLAAGAVWAAGDPWQRHDVARLLLTGGRIAVVHRGPVRAGAPPHGEITARRVPGGYRLDGRAPATGGALPAGLHLVHARTGAPDGPGGHSVLLVDPAGRNAGTIRRLPGARGDALEFRDRFVPRGALVGREGDGVVLALRALQVEHAVLCAGLTAAGDTALHHAVRTATDGSPGRIAPRRHRPLAGVFADLLACRAVTTAALRALSLLPSAAHLLAAAVRYVVPGLLRPGLEELVTVLGAHAHGADGPGHGAPGGLMRALSAAESGHAGAAACRSVLVAHLRALAERSWFTEPEPPPALFAPGAGLPPLDHTALAVAGGGDFMAACLVGCARRLAAPGAAGGRTAVLAELLVAELRALATRCRRLPAAAPAPAALVLADRYGLLVCAAAVLRAREAQDGAGPFPADPAWAELALSRIGERLGLPVPGPPDDVRERLVEELLHRHRDGGGLPDAAATAP
ncbi:hypothetical protein, partial [Streptomyces viridosporus]|uniref:hypothetical protein n=1 Tax=Streptomyces viridosporus TaxID=67581 RepID=UPI0009C13DB1